MDLASNSHGKTYVLRVQPTTSCNLNCDYCYIPEKIRTNKHVMHLSVLSLALGALKSDGLIGESITLSWHGGEPLMAPIAWYRSAMEIIENFFHDKDNIRYVFQTNGSLISNDWAKLFLSMNASVGVSLDGSRKSNIHRVNWSNRPSFDKSLRGIKILNDHEISWSMMSVVDRAVLEDQSEFIDFVLESGCKRLAIKVDELSIVQNGVDQNIFIEKYRNFVSRLYSEIVVPGKIKVRDIDLDSRDGLIPSILVPLSDITIDVDGNFSIFSPDLMFAYGDKFVSGNVKSGSISDSLSKERNMHIINEILVGVMACKKHCEYFDICGSKYLSQKYFEHGRFDVTETRSCRLEVKELRREFESKVWL